MIASVYAVGALCSALLKQVENSQAPIDMQHDLKDRCSHLLLWVFAHEDNVSMAELEKLSDDVAQTAALINRYLGSVDHGDD